MGIDYDKLKRELEDGRDTLDISGDIWDLMDRGYSREDAMEELAQQRGVDLRRCEEDPYESESEHRRKEENEYFFWTYGWHD